MRQEPLVDSASFKAIIDPVLLCRNGEGEETTADPSTPPRFANLACGGKLCRLPGWLNVDHCPSSREVMRADLLKRLPFSDNTFDVVYHSQFIEHLPPNRANGFLAECYRILKPNGVMRLVTPDLENQAAEYLRNLHALLDDPADAGSGLRYTWIRLEMLDQLNRHYSGGEMAEFVAQHGAQLQDYLRQRLGRSGDELMLRPDNGRHSKSVKTLLRKVKRRLGGIGKSLTPSPWRIGKFRTSGEVHLCMYDRYLLTATLSACQFADISVVSATESRIPGWNQTLLDADKEGNADCPASLFIEAVKGGSSSGSLVS